VSSAAFVAGFLAVWSAIGAAYLLPFLWFRSHAADASEPWWLPVVAGAILVLAGGYQFSRRKAHCQGACCAPVTLVLDHDAGTGLTSALRTGIDHLMLGRVVGAVLVILGLAVMASPDLLHTVSGAGTKAPASMDTP